MYTKSWILQDLSLQRNPTRLISQENPQTTVYFEFQENIGDALLKAEALKLQFVGEMSGLKHFD